MDQQDLIKLFSAVQYMVDTVEYGRDDNKEAFEQYMNIVKGFTGNVLNDMTMGKFDNEQ